MDRIRKLYAALVVGAGLAFTSPALAEGAVKIGLLTDMSSVLSSASGQGSVIAAEMAIEDYGGELLGRKIELISADHQNKGDIGSSIARKWLYEEDVKLFMDIASSVVALALRELVQENNVSMIYGSASSAVLTNQSCSPNTVSWGHDSYQLTRVVSNALLERGDAHKKWFLIVQDWAFGHSLQEELTRFVEAGGGEIVGAVRHSPGTTDYASFLLQAQTSGADVIGFLTSVADLSNITKQAAEFGIGRDGTQSIVAPVMLWADSAAIGPETAQGLLFSTVWYWNLNPEAQAWSKRFYERAGVLPSEAHAAAYSSLTHWLKAVEALGGDTDGQKVIAKMKEIPVSDFYTDNAVIRKDGRLLRNAYLVRIKAPAEIAQEWDYYEVLATVPGELAFRPAAESQCPLMQ